MDNKNTPLAQPFKVGNLTAKNRFCIQPMECCDGDEKGIFTEDSLERYENLFAGGAGVIVMESITLQFDTRARKTQLMLDVDDPENRKAWEKFVKNLKTKYPDPIFIVQLNHSGEVSAETFSHRVCVKPLYGFGGEVIGEEYIDGVIDSFVKASKFLYDIGVDGVDVKFCHGYLGSQILRPYNDRKWKYGGSWENRSRFAFDMIEKIRKAVNDDNFLVGAKVTMYEGMPGGQGHAGPDSPLIDLTESIDLVKGCEERGASFFIETLGNPSVTWDLMTPNSVTADDVYMHMTMAKILKDNVKPETLVVGGGLSILGNGKYNKLRGVKPEWNNLFHWGNYMVGNNHFDMIALGRQSFADPFLPKKYMENREDEINWCTCCNGCSELMIRQNHVGCAVYNKKYVDLLKKVRAEKGRLKRVVTGDE
ncbi:2,4-dienoyl-CoA reductase [Clostridium sp.]|jgi:2,4-dienoyl-CoA reductase-like NADH-dependent reductase (Old Yellow Enzyme family)|uniref:oxidoreductase n=1 Tax=Clostridium sp. TaxID=1506 RepID=UPI003A5BE01F